MKKYRQAVSALVLRPSNVCSKDGCSQVSSILLVHKPRNRDAWQLPQGGIEAGEDCKQAAIRELKEETGLTFTSVNHVSPCEYCYDFPKEFLQRNAPCNDGQRLCFVVIETDQSAKVTVDKKEIDAYVWVLPEQLPQYIDRKVYLDVIKEVLADYEKRAK